MLWWKISIQWQTTHTWLKSVFKCRRNVHLQPVPALVCACEKLCASGALIIVWTQCQGWWWICVCACRDYSTVPTSTRLPSNWPPEGLSAGSRLTTDHIDDPLSPPPRTRPEFPGYRSIFGALYPGTPPSHLSAHLPPAERLRWHGRHLCDVLLFSYPLICAPSIPLS